MSDHVIPSLPDPEPEPIKAQGRNFTVSGDQVNMATANLPDAQRSAIRWFHAHCREHDLKLSEGGKLIGYDNSTLHRVFAGKYEGNLDNICKSILSFKRLEDSRSNGRKLKFVHTSLSKHIFNICDAALTYQRINYIYGDSQIGKTTALQEYQATHNHGSTIYVRMPTGGGTGDFLVLLAEAMRISPYHQDRDLKRRICRGFDDRMLLIVDEAHQCLIGNTPAAIKTIEFIREIYDTSQCGVVICATNIFRREVETGRFAGVFKQTIRRRLATLQLNSVSSAKDLNTFAAEYGLEPATGKALTLQTDINTEEGVGMWLILLRIAAKIANGQGKKLTWTHVIEASAGLKSLELGEEK